MTLHLRTLTIKYLSGQTITKIMVINKIDLPEILISAVFASGQPCCENIVNMIKKDHAHIELIILRRFSKDLIKKLDNIEKDALMLKEILYQYGYDYFRRQIFPKLLEIVSCTVFLTNDEVYNCKNMFNISTPWFDYAIRHNTIFIDYGLRSIKLFSKIGNKNFEKISIEYNVHCCFLGTVKILENSEIKYGIFPGNNTQLNIIYQKEYLRKSMLSLSDGCESLGNNISYDLIQCKRNKINSILLNKYKFDCMPRDNSYQFIEDLNFFGNKYCQYNKTMTLTFTADDIRSIEKSCPKACESEFLTVKYNTKYYTGATKINLIPKANFKPIFTHHLSMDINKFIYDIGGTIGMWFCVSALTLPDYIYHLFKNIIYPVNTIFSTKISH